jgi:hypothetical protein
LHSFNQKALTAEAFIPENLLKDKSEGGGLYAFARLRRMRDSVAQLVEQYTFNVWALGSSPSRITTQMFNIFKSPQEYNSEGFFVAQASWVFLFF